MELTNALILPDGTISNDIMPANGYFFTMEEISLVFSGPIAPLFFGSHWIFYSPGNFDLQYNEYFTKYCGFVIHGPVVVLSQKFIPPYFMVQGLLRYNDGTPQDSEFIDDEPLYANDMDREAILDGDVLNRPTYDLPDSELDHYNNIIESITPLFGKIWNIDDTNLMVYNIFGDFSEVKKPFDFIFHNFVFWYDEESNQEFLVTSKIKQLAFCESLYSFKVKNGLQETDGQGFNQNHLDYQFKQCEMITEYIGFLRNQIKNRYKLDEF